MKTNQSLQQMIKDLKQLGTEKNINLWKRVASDLNKSTRQKRVVNLSRINRYTKENDTIVVPGKVLGSGLLSHKLTVAAFSFSKSALDKIASVNGKAINITDLTKEEVKNKKIKLIG